jgi:hypothetical protein
MCMRCLAESGPYLLGTAVLLRAQASWIARRSRREAPRVGATDALDGTARVCLGEHRRGVDHRLAQP